MQIIKSTTTALCFAATLASSIVLPQTAIADVSANVGYASEYYFRGILQKSSSASAGLDYSQGDLTLGTWAADVGDGLEIDLYGSYGFKFSEDFSASVGFTGYYYTGEFDDTYEEINLGFAYKILSVDYAKGGWDGGDATSDDYDYLAITLSHDNFYGKYATFGDEFDGDYFEFGYATTIGGFDTSIALIFSSDELSDQLDSFGNPTESEALVFSLAKTFEL
ncbi:MAG: hypothetical protein HWE11_08935 [Gammaproteobacteria bacterium]|nr:hypothetical protein [Gammaproteobacteria bacterium]